MWKSIAVICSSSLAVLWAAHYYGGLCSRIPVIVAIIVFILIAAISMIDVLNDSSGARNWVLSVGLVAVIVGTAVGATLIAGSAKDSIHVADIDGSVGVAHGQVVKVNRWYQYGRVKRVLRHSYKFYYEYTVNGESFKQCGFATARIVKVGEKVTVLYLVSHPAVARLLKPDEKLPEG